MARLTANRSKVFVKKSRNFLPVPKPLGADVRGAVNNKSNSMRKMSYGPKATVCTKGTCVTVYGPAAQLVTAVVVLATVLIAVALVIKAIR